MVERAIREDQRAVTGAELQLLRQELTHRLETVEREIEMKASTVELKASAAAVEYQTKLLQVEMRHLVEGQEEIKGFLKKAVAVILIAVAAAVLSQVLGTAEADSGALPSPPQLIEPSQRG